MPSPKIIIANHKMNFNFKQLRSWLDVFLTEVNSNLLNKSKLYLAVPACNLYPLNQTLLELDLSQSIIPVAQSISPHLEGAYTGQISIKQLDLTAGAVLVGHSESREVSNFTNQDYGQMVRLALQAQKKVFFCIGESFEEYQNNQTFAKLAEQLSEIKDLLIAPNQISICYEPIWAIGSGIQPKVESILSIKNYLRQLVGEEFTILYGGSVNASNLESTVNFGLDGVLVGGASLDAREFAKIYNAIL